MTTQELEQAEKELRQKSAELSQAYEEKRDEFIRTNRKYFDGQRVIVFYKNKETLAFVKNAYLCDGFVAYSLEISDDNGSIFCTTTSNISPIQESKEKDLKEIGEDFKLELKGLLEKYNARLTADYEGTEDEPEIGFYLEIPKPDSKDSHHLELPSKKQNIPGGYYINL